MKERLSFKEFYHKKHPHVGGEWGVHPEYIHDVIRRMADTFAEYVDDRLNTIENERK